MAWKPDSTQPDPTARPKAVSALTPEEQAQLDQDQVRYGMLPNWVHGVPGLEGRPEVRCTLAVLLSFWNPKTQSCFPSNARLGRLLRLTPRQLQRHLQLLETCGVVRRKQGPGRPGLQGRAIEFNFEVGKAQKYDIASVAFRKGGGDTRKGVMRHEKGGNATRETGKSDVVRIPAIPSSWSDRS